MAVTVLEVAYKSIPYAGYSAISDMMKSTQLESVLAFYVMLIQLQMIQLFLAIWPAPPGGRNNTHSPLIILGSRSPAIGPESTVRSMWRRRRRSS